MQRWLNLGLRQEKYKMDLEHLVVPVRKEGLKTKTKSLHELGFVIETHNPTERALNGQSLKNLSNEIKKN